MSRRSSLALVLAVAAVTASCAADVGVTAERADEIALVAPAPDDPADPSDPDDPTTSEPEPVDPPTTEPADPAAIDLGPDKPVRAYDEFLLTVVSDLDRWWTDLYPELYGTPFEPREGEIYAAYPGRPDDLPGCGTDRTTYLEVQQYVAFYCGVGDFIIYDDGDDGLLTELARDYGAATIGTVLAHEYAHAIQLRSGALDRALPTVLTEQQADCFAGAWTARVASGASPFVTFEDGDVRAGLIAMTKVSDPVGLDQFVAGGHGSAFDRVGAFQVGYAQGAARCAEILDDPLPLVPNEFLNNDELTTGGNAPFGYGDGELIGFLPQDLNDYWDEELATEIPDLGPQTLVVVQSVDDVPCDDLRGDLASGSAWCASTDEVYFNEPVARDLYDDFGDFSVGYVLGAAWSEAVLDALGADLTGEARALMNDCLTGGWVKTVVPVPSTATASGYALPLPRLAEREVSVSAGDLDEAIQTVLLLADPEAGDDVVGSAFEKIAAFRQGVIDGTDSCLAEL